MSASVDEYDAISKAIQHYIEGAKSGRSDDMKPAFHDDATMFGFDGPHLEAGPIQQLFDWHDGNGAAPEIHARITSIDLAETVATVRLEIDDWTGDRYTDMFTMLKVDGQWKIINKVFHLYTAPA